MTATSILPPVKFCKKCQCETERYKGGGCKPCAVSNAAKWKSENKDKEAMTKARYYQKHKDAVKETSSRTYSRNKEKVCEAATLWAVNNPEKCILARKKHAASGKEKLTKQMYAAKNATRIRDAKRLWIKSNPDAVRRMNHVRRARKSRSGGNLSSGITQKLFSLQRGRCACCGLLLGDRYDLDHIMPLALGGSNTDDNVQLLRQRCNRQKHAKHPIYFMQSRGFLL